MNNQIGYLVGRLSPPRHGHQSFPDDVVAEFITANSIDLHLGQWLWDEDDHGLLDMPIPIGDPYGVKCDSILADRWKCYPDCDLAPLAKFCKNARIGTIVLPWFTKNTAHLRRAVDFFREVTPRPRLLVEANVEPTHMHAILLAFPELGVNYDVGNSVALGFDMHAEFAEYGHRIESVHIKDRPHDSITINCHLGSGCVKWREFGDLLGQYDYRGPLILETSRGWDGHEKEHIAGNVEFLKANVIPAIEQWYDGQGNRKRPSD